ncbi:ABC transporter substrate-binding protein [Paenibacillus sp. FSL K6-2862]|uniref:ABC transporter substrate-binding protein n=1 Tax=Paenibacillus sp. FSL K6-2862 TaxID=2921484 RepID=UPI0030F739BB
MVHHRMKHLISLSLILVVMLSLAACGQAGNTMNTSAQTEGAAGNSTTNVSANSGTASGGITVTDARGELQLDKAPERIVAMDFSFTDMLVSLGVQPVGIADDGTPELFMDSVKDKLGDYLSVGSRYEPNIELISSVQPDLIIVDINKHGAAIPQLEKIAPLLVLDDFQADYDQMLKNFNILATAVGKEQEGSERLAEHEQFVQDIKAKLTGKDLTILPAVVNPTGFFGHSDHSYTGSIVKLLGFTDPLQNEKSYPELTLENLSELNPQVLFLMPTAEVTIANEWEKNPLWNSLDAVSSKQIYTVERRNWSLSRGLLGSEQIMADMTANLEK